jgi:hypothetical protein
MIITQEAIEVAAGIGLCASAEALLDQATQCRPEGGVTEKNLPQHVQSATLRSMAAQMLELAEIPYGAWLATTEPDR